MTRGLVDVTVLSENMHASEEVIAKMKAAVPARDESAPNIVAVACSASCQAYSLDICSSLGIAIPPASAQ